MTKGLKVLIAESHPDVAQTLDAMLDAIGHSSVVALTFDHARQAAREQAFDAYVIDLEFADCGGVALLGSLRRDQLAAPARAIGWTGAFDLWGNSHALTLFDAVLVKPASIAEITAILEDAAWLRRLIS